MTTERAVEDLLRHLTPRVLGAVVRRFGDFDRAEDAVQEALVVAAEQWTGKGPPANPGGWLFQVAARRMIDRIRSDEARCRREDLTASSAPVGAADQPPPSDRDDSLTILFMCCHPTLPPAAAIALTLRAVGGLTTAEIAKAFLVPAATMAQRISRAKQRIKSSAVPFSMPTDDERNERLGSVLHWPHILALYDLLERMSDNPIVSLNRAIAAAMVDGPVEGLKLLEALDGPLAGHHRLAAVRAHLHELAGDTEAAIEHYRAAAGATASLPERTYLTTKAARLRTGRGLAP